MNYNTAEDEIHECLLRKEEDKFHQTENSDGHILSGYHNKDANGRRYRINSSSQTALVGTQLSQLESLDYEIPESDLFKQDWRSRSKKEIFHYIVLKWTLAFLIGLFVGIIASFVNFVIENISSYKLQFVSDLILKKRSVLGFGILAGSNIFLTLLATSLTAFIGPAAAGAGVPEIKAYLNGVDLPNFFGPNTLFVKVFGSIFAVSAGLDLGKEGPLIHTGSCIASILGQGGSRRYGLTWRWLKFFKNDRDRRDLITCGAAAGVAAAFRAPIGGVLFALEEIATWWRSALLWRTFFTTAVVAVVLRGFIDFCGSEGHCGKFGSGGLIMFDVSAATIRYKFISMLPVVVLGIIGGIFGAIYNFLLNKTLRVYAIINQKGALYKMLLSAAVALMTSCFIFGLPWLASCTPCPAGAAHECPSKGNFKQFHCRAGHYNDLATLLFNTVDATIKNLFSSGTPGEFSQASLMIYLVTIFLLGLITYGLALPSGLFIPVILIGSTYGRALGEMIGPFIEIDQGLCAVLGAASFLGGSMRMTVSLCVILLELTNNLTLLPFVMLVLLISKTIGDAFNSSVYDQIVRLKGLPFLEAHAEPYMRVLRAAEVITNPLVSFKGVERVSTIMQTLTNTGHSGFPVINDRPHPKPPVLHGLILRSHLLVLLHKKVFMPTPEITLDVTHMLNPKDFAKPGSGKGLKLKDIELDPEELNMYVDLHPFCNTSPYTVADTCSVAKAYALFRHLGLRHLCVVPKEPGRYPIVGILTRHDFMPEHIFDVAPFLRERKRKRLGAYPGP